MEPMLIEDLKIQKDKPPKTITNLFQFFNEEKINFNRTDIISGVIYIIALECGFIPIEFQEIYADYQFNYQKLLHLTEKLPKNWKRNNFNVFDFNLAGFKEVCKINIILLNEDVLINSMMTTNEGIKHSYQTVVDPLTYFTSSKTHLHANKLQNLNHLAKIVKENVLNPIKVTILTNNGQYYPTLRYLPNELLLKIALYLNGKDLIQFSIVCQCFLEVSKNPVLWRSLLKREFGNIDTEISDYKSLKSEFVNLFRRRAIRNRIFFH